MGLDRFVLFKGEKPTLEQLRLILEDYLGGLGTIDYQDGCWFVSFPGKPSFPFKRSHPDYAYMGGGLNNERWFEVYIGSLDQEKGENMGPNVDIITRMQDELTNNIAAGFAKLLRRFYKAESDEEQEEADA